MDDSALRGLDKRVYRERLAHTEDDVLASNLKLKSSFHHVLTSPTMRRFENDLGRMLNCIPGKVILDIGCGMGKQAVSFLRSGARKVVGIDISSKYIEASLASADQAGYDSDSFSFLVMDAHKLDFKDDSFDLVIGRGILHHLDVPDAMREIRRVLRPGGQAIFHEPLGDNPLLGLFRFLTPRARTIDERPLTKRDLLLIGEGWESDYSYYGLAAAPIAMLTSILLPRYNDNFFLRVADLVEQRTNRIAFFGSLNQYVLIRLIKPSLKN